MNRCGPTTSRANGLGRFIRWSGTWGLSPAGPRPLWPNASENSRPDTRSLKRSGNCSNVTPCAGRSACCGRWWRPSARESKLRCTMRRRPVCCRGCGRRMDHAGDARSFSLRAATASYCPFKVNRTTKKGPWAHWPCSIGEDAGWEPCISDRCLKRIKQRSRRTSRG